MMDFIYSLGVIGYVIIILLIVLIWNIRGIIFLRSPLDSQQHKIWRETGGTTKADHLENTENTAFGTSQSYDTKNDRK